METAAATDPVIENFKADLLSGRTFVLHAASARSEIGYRPPIDRRAYAQALTAVARMAASSDRLVPVAAAIVGKLNPYGTNGQLRAAAYDAAFLAMDKDYRDVIGLAGPEAGRESDHHHPWTLRDRVAVMYFLADAFAGIGPDYKPRPHIGWALAAVADEIGYRHS